MKQKVKFIEVQKHYPKSYLEGFIEVYKEAFAGPPYFESYEDEWIRDNIWEPHLNSGCIVLALLDDQVIGLGCCIILGNVPSRDPKKDLNLEIKEFLLSLPKKPFNVDKTCYMSDIAVSEVFRYNGVGINLIKKRIAWAKNNDADHYVMRTATEASNSRNLYLSLGAKEIPNAIQDVSEHAKVVNSASNTRVYLFGNTS